MSIKRHLGVVLCATALVAGCSDSNPAVGPSAAALHGTAGATATAEQATVNEIARAVSMALRDQGLRQRIKNDMRSSRFDEHKLDMRAYLHGQSGGILLAKMAKETGRSRDELLALVGRVRPLEMYFPVAAHRESWAGGPDLQVMGYLGESGQEPTAYTLDGAPVAVSSRTAPALPTLVLVQRETDFTRPLLMTRVDNVRDRNGQSIGTYSAALSDSDCSFSENDLGVVSAQDAGGMTVTCGGSGGTIGGSDSGGGGTAVPATDPRYRTSQGYGLREVIKDYKQHYGLESWYQGSPELYVEVTSHASAPGDPTKPYFTARARFGEGKNDDTDWHDAGTAHLIQWNAEYGNYVHLKFYEQDGENMINFTVTFQGKTYGIKIPDSNEDLGAWTYSFGDQSLTTGIDGRGAGKFGANTGALTFITDYMAF